MAVADEKEGVVNSNIINRDTKYSNEMIIHAFGVFTADAMNFPDSSAINIFVTFERQFP